jgi:hypothetical protein
MLVRVPCCRHRERGEGVLLQVCWRHPSGVLALVAGGCGVVDPAETWPSTTSHQLTSVISVCQCTSGSHQDTRLFLCRHSHCTVWYVALVEVIACAVKTWTWRHGPRCILVQGVGQGRQHRL